MPNSEQINFPSSNHTCTKSTPKHIHHHIVIPGFVDIPRRSDCTSGQMDGEAGWWTTSGNIGLPPLARVMGVGRQQQQEPSSLHNSKHTKHTKGKGIQPNGSPCAVTLDVSKFFDTINTHTLIKKLLHTNITGTIIKLIANYIK